MSFAFGTTNHVTLQNENRTLLAGKQVTGNVLKRPALGEIGNTLDRFAIPGVTNAAKKNQPEKSATFVKDSKLTRLVKPAIRRQLQHTESSSSLFPSSTLHQQADSKDSEGIEDIDKDDLANPLLVASYAPDIYRYLLELEEKFPVKQDYLRKRDITPKMRATLVDWLVDVQEQYKLLQETLFLSIAIVDRYLQGVQTDRNHLQLVGITALFIAGKFEEIYPLDVGELVFVTDNAYTKGEVLKMEKKILKELNFDLGKPVSLHFLRRFSKVAKVLPIHHNFSKYFLEWSLMDYELCHIRPSRLAAAALFIAKCICGKTELKSDMIWNGTLEHFSGVPLVEVQAVAVQMAAVVLRAQNSKYKAIDRKYSSSKLMKVCQRPELSTESFKRLAKGTLP